MIPAQLYTNASSRLGACLDFQAQTAQTAAKVQPDPQRCRSSRSLDALSRNRHCSPTHNISSTSTCSTADRLQKPSKTKPTHTELQGPTHNISSTTVAGTHHSSQWNPLSPLMPHTAYPPPLANPVPLQGPLLKQPAPGYHSDTTIRRRTLPTLPRRACAPLEAPPACQPSPSQEYPHYQAPGPHHQTPAPAPPCPESPLTQP